MLVDASYYVPTHNNIYNPTPTQDMRDKSSLLSMTPKTLGSLSEPRTILSIKPDQDGRESESYDEDDEDDDENEDEGPNFSPAPRLLTHTLITHGHHHHTLPRTAQALADSHSKKATSSNNGVSASGTKPKERAWCNMLIKEKTHTHVHMMMSSPERLEKAQSSKKGKFYCTHCDTKYSTILELCGHMDDAGLTRPFHCPEPACPWYVCGFPTSSEWSRHTKSQHGPQKFCYCPICNKAFARKDSLKRHIQLVHDNLESRYNRKKRIRQEQKMKGVRGASTNN